jgi:hypothetical protein
LSKAALAKVAPAPPSTPPGVFRVSDVQRYFGCGPARARTIIRGWIDDGRVEPVCYMGKDMVGRGHACYGYRAKGAQGGA